MNIDSGGIRMIAPDLVELRADGPRLVVGRRRSDGALVFPMPRDRSTISDRVPLSARGALWSWTVQRFRPKSPPYRGPAEESFRPYVVGYVQFPEGIVVEGYIDVPVEGEPLRIGQPMQTTLLPLITDADGSRIHIFAFRP